MPWVISREKEAARDRCLERIAYAQRLVEAASRHTADLSIETHATVGGHTRGSRIDSHVHFSVDELKRVAENLSDAEMSARSLDVTVWVDEDDDSDEE